MVCGIYFPDQGFSPGPLHWEPQVLTLDHQGSPHMSILKSDFIFFLLHALKNVYVTQISSFAWDGWYFSVEFTSFAPMGFIPFFNKCGYDLRTVKCTDHNRGFSPPPTVPPISCPLPFSQSPTQVSPGPSALGISRRLLSTLQASLLCALRHFTWAGIGSHQPSVPVRALSHPPPQAQLWGSAPRASHSPVQKIIFLSFLLFVLFSFCCLTEWHFKHTNT